ncbi:hypothetical protein AVEN_232896-1 [Araneus ventricosus]|uniref:Uncharacterized protein n=1 Tax=Araneus ventricosus TaxID=182803 RepID=A0A4Y2SZM9_ARAVE|nr:hypothetical protein AVEN_232896-1 [Araneus ventricosus]
MEHSGPRADTLPPGHLYTTVYPRTRSQDGFLSVGYVYVDHSIPPNSEPGRLPVGWVGICGPQYTPRTRSQDGFLSVGCVDLY